MTHTSQNFEECFTEPPPDVSIDDFPDVPTVGPAVCAHRDANGNRCDERIQRCAPGCPSKDNTNTDEPTLRKKVEGPLTKRFAELEKIAVPVTPERIVDADGKAIAPEDVMRGGIDEQVPAVNFKFPLKNIKAGQPVNALFSAGPPEALPIQSIIFTPETDIVDGTFTVSIVDGAKPELLDKGAPGSPDYNRPEYNLAKEWIQQSLDRYKLKYIISADATIGPPSSPYEPASMSEVLFKMVTSLLPVGEGFANPETEVALLHLNKNKWDPLPVEKGAECLFDGNACTFTARSPGFSIFALALKEKSGGGFLPWLLIISWAFAIFFIYRRYWKNTALKLRTGSKSEKKRAAKAVGFGKFVFISGILLFGNSMTLVFTLLALFSSALDVAKFVDMYVANIIGGFFFGLILWLITTRK